MVRRSPSPNCPPTGRAVGVRHPHALGAGEWVWGPNTVPLACVPFGGCVPRGWWGAVPGGMACHRCEGRLVSDAVPPPAASPLGRAAGVPQPVCPGCGRCGRGDPAPAPQRAPLRAGVARCGGGGRASPRGVPSTVVRGVCGQALPLPELPAHWAGCWGPPPTCCGRGSVGVGAQHCPLGLHALWGLRAVGVVGGRPRGGWPATVVRGVWCQALSLPRPPVLWGGQPGFRDPCVPGAVGAGVGPSTGPTACALAGRRCSLWGWRKGVPGGVPSTVVRGVCGQTLPLPELPAHWAGCWGPPPTCCGCGGCGRGDPSPTPQRALLRAVGPRGGRLLPGCGASGVGRSPTPDHSSVRACVRGPVPM